MRKRKLRREFADREERVPEVMAHVMGIEEWQGDMNEATVMAMIGTTCGYMRGIGSQPCSSQFTSYHVLSV